MVWFKIVMDEERLEELRQLRQHISDGIDDTWMTLPVDVIRTFVDERLLAELQELERRLKTGVELKTILDQRILQLSQRLPKDSWEQYL